MQTKRHNNDTRKQNGSGKRGTQSRKLRLRGASLASAGGVEAPASGADTDCRAVRTQTNKWTESVQGETTAGRRRKPGGRGNLHRGEEEACRGVVSSHPLMLRYHDLVEVAAHGLKREERQGRLEGVRTRAKKKTMNEAWVFLLLFSILADSHRREQKRPTVFLGGLF